jgi:tetratricopeptide (TPR) repeat protein
MKKLLPLVLVSAFALAACGPSAEKLTNQGNEAFYTEDYAGALAAYQQAQEDSPELAEPHYNAANAHYRQGEYEQTLGEIEQTLIKDEGGLAENSFYNLGNTFFQAQQLEQAVEAYKEALRLSPGDVEAKQNLELALRMMQQQQENQEDSSDQGDQEQQDGQQNDQQQDDQQGDQGDDQQQDDQQGDQQDQDQPQDGQQDEQQQDHQARQLLQAAAEGTESLEEHLQQILLFSGAPPAEDW